MAKLVKAKVRLMVDAGRANPAPPVGPALSPFGIDTKHFCDQFNEKTKEMNGLPIPVVITIFEDRSFNVEYRSPPTSALIKKALNLKSGSGVPNAEKVGRLSKQQLDQIVEEKIDDFNTDDKEKAYKIICGTAKQMGVEVEGFVQ